MDPDPSTVMTEPLAQKAEVSSVVLTRDQCGERNNPKSWWELAQGLGQQIYILVENKTETCTPQLPVEEQLLSPKLVVVSVLQPDNSEKTALSASFVSIKHS